MALGEDFISSEELRIYLGIDAGKFTQELTDAVESSTQEIIRWCHRDFNDAETVSMRMYRPFKHPDYGPMIITDDFSSVEGLVITSGSATIDPASLLLEPLNGVMQGVTGWPYWRVAGGFSLDQMVTVAARWGWAAVPKPVRQASFILGTDTFQLKDQRLGIAGSDQFGQVVTVKDSRAAKAKLRAYRRDTVLMDG